MKVWPSEVDRAQAVPVFFAKSATVATGSVPPGPAVYIVPDKAAFNNFGRYYWAELYLVRPDVPLEQMSVMLMFAGISNTKGYLDGLFDEFGAQTVPTSGLSTPFVTLFNMAASYAAFVEALGFGVAVATLREMGDAVVLAHEGAREGRAALLSTIDFHEGVLRNGEAYAALRGGGKHLTPYETVPRSDARGRIAFTATVKGAELDVDAVFDFTRDELMRDRLAVLIGRNGVGKTQLVQSMIEGLRRHRESWGDTETLPAVFREAPVGSKVVVLSSVAADTYPRRIPAWSGLDYEYLSLVPQPNQDSRSLLSVLLDCTRDPATYAFRFRGDQLDRYGVLKLLLRRLGLWDELYVPILDSAVDDVFRSDRVFDGGRYVSLRLNLGEQRQIRIVAEADHSREIVILTEEGEARQLSSGESAMFRFTVNAVAAIEFGSFLILEEPESYLHPNFVSEMMAILHDLLEATGSVALAVTHSAYVVREATRERVNVMRDAAKGREIVHAPLQTFGASIDSISQFVFGDARLSHQYLETLREWLRRNRDMTVERLRDEYAEQLNPETMSYLVGLLREDAWFSLEAAPE
jgi:energy-coupling factor transporter ATP-binding protein EcfA2